jgi:hypothetical protein
MWDYRLWERQGRLADLGIVSGWVLGEVMAIVGGLNFNINTTGWRGCLDVRMLLR